MVTTSDKCKKLKVKSTIDADLLAKTARLCVRCEVAVISIWIRSEFVVSVLSEFGMKSLFQIEIAAISI